LFPNALPKILSDPLIRALNRIVACVDRVPHWASCRNATIKHNGHQDHDKKHLNCFFHKNPF